MGDRTWWYEPCPNCQAEMEVVDAPSSLIWSRRCEMCQWNDGRNYYEVGLNNIALCTEGQLQEMMNNDPAIKEFREEIDKLNALIEED